MFSQKKKFLKTYILLYKSNQFNAQCIWIFQNSFFNLKEIFFVDFNTLCFKFKKDL